MKFTFENYTDGPAFRNSGWKLHGQKNGHIITRYTAHGSHHKIYTIKDYHTLYDNCICKICKKCIDHRYHLDEHASNISLTTLLSSIDDGEDIVGILALL
uniref:Uncharacterized protein n=1 Tax=Cacopsylla melanoneura TaxID=428564 RepID=A0A8D8R970_9HEMI